MTGAAKSMHLIYGAPPDPRNIVRGRARHLLVLLTVAPLLLISFSSAALASTLVGPLLDAAGLHSGWVQGMLVLGGLVLGYAVDVLVLWVLLGNLGGIRPLGKPRLLGALAGGVGALVVKQDSHGTLVAQDAVFRVIVKPVGPLPRPDAVVHGSVRIETGLRFLVENFVYRILSVLIRESAI